MLSFAGAFDRPNTSPPPDSFAPPASLSLSHFERVKELQTGSEGVVEAWKHRSTGSLVAVKIISRWKTTAGEVNTLRELPPHEHIIGYLGIVEKEPAFAKQSILLEYCGGGDLFQVTRNPDHDNGACIVSEAFMWSVYIQVSAAFAFLHEGVDEQHSLGRAGWRPIVHRDVKIENILVKSLGTKDDMSDIQLKLGDFGASCFYDPASRGNMQTFGTTGSWPPEMMEKNTKWNIHYAPAADVWGVGAIIHDLAHTFLPIVSPEYTRYLWMTSDNEKLYKKGWSKARKSNYWGARAPRLVVPINLEPDAPLPKHAGFLGANDDPDAAGLRKRRPSPKYSDLLNSCMMLALNMDPEQRMGAGVLWTTVLEMYSDHLMEQLPSQHEQHLRQLAEDDTW